MPARLLLSGRRPWFLGLALLVFFVPRTPYLPSPPDVVDQDVAGEACDTPTASGQDATLVRQQAEHLARLGVARWHAAGYRGQGIKVAILDTGFRDYRSQLGRALPQRVQTQSFRLDSNLEARDSQHGILCGEIIHALAPDAELLFANWEPDHPEHFLAAARWARAQGARLLCCSVIMPAWSDGAGGGEVHQTLAEITGSGKDSGDLLFFASAGNVALRHWSGSYQETTGGFHAWKRGQTDNLLSPWSDEQVSVELYGQAGAEYEVSIFDGTDGAVVGRSAAKSERKRCWGVVRFQPRRAHSYFVRVRLVRGTAGRFHLVALHSGLEHGTPQGSICFPGDGLHVITVGAVDAEGRRLEYSSCGASTKALKPDLVAPVPFTSWWRARQFSGTSAASPQVAALAALWWCRYPEWTAEQVRSALRVSTRDLLTPGPDCETGHGLVFLP